MPKDAVAVSENLYCARRSTTVNGSNAWKTFSTVSVLSSVENCLLLCRSAAVNAQYAFGRYVAPAVTRHNGIFGTRLPTALVPVALKKVGSLTMRASV